MKANDRDHGRLVVSANRRTLEYEDGTPFFYLADTAWELFHRLDREDADRYLTDRARKGFTAIQAVILAEIGGLDDPNPYGEVPLIDQDPTRPNDAYFRHVDDVVARAGKLGLVVGMLFHTSDNVGFQTFTPPTSGRGNDWILILEDVEAEWTLPT